MRDKKYKLEDFDKVTGADVRKFVIEVRDMVLMYLQGGMTVIRTHFDAKTTSYIVQDYFVERGIGYGYRMTINGLILKETLSKFPKVAEEDLEYIDIVVKDIYEEVDKAYKEQIDKKNKQEVLKLLNHFNK